MIKSEKNIGGLKPGKNVYIRDILNYLKIVGLKKGLGEPKSASDFLYNHYTSAVAEKKTLKVQRHCLLMRGELND